MLERTVFEKVQKADKKILLVTKYWDNNVCQKIMQEAENNYQKIVYWLWENRTETIKEKSTPREKNHFIWNIQSRKIPEIVKYCSCIHSLASIKHAEKINTQWFSTSVFIQIKLDEHKDIWIWESELADFLAQCKNFENINIIWISGMWSADIWETEKREEFKKLISLRDMYIPQWLISAGTSRDYELALEEWIDIVRVGTAIIKKEA